MEEKEDEWKNKPFFRMRNKTTLNVLSDQMESIDFK